MPWCQIHISPEEARSGKQSLVRDAFLTVIAAGSASPDLAVFSRFNSDDGSTDLFVSPSLAKVASPIVTRFEGQNCSKPESGTVSLLVGSQNAFKEFELR